MLCAECALRCILRGGAYSSSKKNVGFDISQINLQFLKSSSILLWRVMTYDYKQLNVSFCEIDSIILILAYRMQIFYILTKCKRTFVICHNFPNFTLDSFNQYLFLQKQILDTLCKLWSFASDQWSVKTM